MKNEIALVGFSVNAELVLTYDRMSTSQEKGILESSVPDLCGTSANVARAITLLGQSSKVLALTGINDDFESHILRFALKQYKVPFSEFKILNHSHFSILPVDGIHTQKVFGKKGNIENDKLEETILKINEETGLWRIATGVRTEEVPLVKELFNKHAGFRSLNPRPELIINREKFLEILATADLLIMNDTEFNLCREISISELHKYGPRLIIVTQGDKGGMFSLRGFKPEKFEPCREYINPASSICETGTGDWFHASFIVRCNELEQSINTLTIKSVRDCISFAARVAGKKVTMIGAANGPTKTEL